MIFEFEKEPTGFSEGFLAIAEAMCSPESIVLAKAESGKYYVQAEAVENYMLCNGIIDSDDALVDIADVNHVDPGDINLVGTTDLIDNNDTDDNGLFDESAVYLDEAAVEDGAMTLKQAESWYNKMLSTCKSKSETKEEINDCISMLKTCLKQMQKAKDNSKGKVTGDRIKYALKSLIPFNSIWRLIKRHDKYSGITAGIGGANQVIGRAVTKKMGKTAAKQAAKGAVMGGFKTAIKAGKVSMGMSLITIGAKGVVRFATYNKMLDNCIKGTNEAIAFLEKKKAELK